MELETVKTLPKMSYSMWNAGVVLRYLSDPTSFGGHIECGNNQYVIIFDFLFSVLLENG